MVLLNRRVLLIDFFLEKLYDKIQTYLVYLLYFLNIGHIFVSLQDSKRYGPAHAHSIDQWQNYDLSAWGSGANDPYLQLLF